jgi:putative phosphoribosyl transferase
VIYHDRSDAGRRLAARLSHHAGDPTLLVLGLPRGGVPVAAEVAEALGAPLDVYVVRKLGLPGQRELAMGAIGSGGVRVMNDRVLQASGVESEAIEEVIREEDRELERRERALRGDRPAPEVEGRTIILVDDGIATGSTMRAAIAALQARGAAKTVVAVPLAASETCAELAEEVDEVVCAATPEPVRAISIWYEDFEQTTDAEVRALVERATRRDPERS